MTLEKLLYRIGEMGIRNKVINYSAAGSSIYEINANTIKSYPILFSSPTGNHKITDNMSEYEITLYYIDRLLNDSGNDIQIFSTAIEQLKYIIRNIDNMSDVLEVSEEYEIVNFTETEALNDRTAGAYTTIRINTKNQSDCYDEDIFTDPIRLQEKSIDITENGHYQVVYDKIYDGISEVDINVNVDVEDYYERGYEQGKTDGYDEGYAVGEQVSYGAGYEQGQVDAAANARVLNVTENGQYGDGETLYKTINVDVVPKINVKEMGLYFGYSTYTEIPSIFDFSDVENMENMFYNNINLKEVRNINTSKVTRFNNAFYGCESLEVVEGMDTSNANEMYSMFYVNGGNANLKKLQKFNCQNVTRIDRLFSRYGDQVNFTDAGGWEGLKCNWNDDRGLIRCPNLSYESCMNIINGLYDFIGNGETPNSEQGQLMVHQNFINLIGEEGLAMATAKGWTITS